MARSEPIVDTFPGSVSYELIAGLNSFELCTYTGELLRIEGSGYTTDDPRIISELDAQKHAVARVSG